MAKKSTAEVPGKYRPSLHIGSEDGLEMPDGEVGDPVKMTVHGKIASHSEHDNGDGPRKSMSVEIHKLEHGDNAKEGMIKTPAADGAKSAMDKALVRADKRVKKGAKEGKVEDGDE